MTVETHFDSSLFQLELGFAPEQPEHHGGSLKPLKPASPFRLRAGDLIRLDDGVCRVLRVSESAAVVEVPQAPREFETGFGKRVRIQPGPRLVRISSNSEVPILKRSEGGAL